MVARRTVVRCGSTTLTPFATAAALTVVAGRLMVARCTVVRCGSTTLTTFATAAALTVMARRLMVARRAVVARCTVVACRSMVRCGPATFTAATHLMVGCCAVVVRRSVVGRGSAAVSTFCTRVVSVVVSVVGCSSYALVGHSSTMLPQWAFTTHLCGIQNAMLGCGSSMIPAAGRIPLIREGTLLSRKSRSSGQEKRNTSYQCVST